MSDASRKLSPEELSRITQEFLDERSRARAAVFARAGFGGGLVPPAPAAPSEDLLVQGIDDVTEFQQGPCAAWKRHFSE